MKLKKLASELCKHEGLKSQVKIGNMREIIKLLGELLYMDYMIYNSELYNGILNQGKRTFYQKRRNKNAIKKG